MPLLLLALGGGCADIFGFDELTDGDRTTAAPDASVGTGALRMGPTTYAGAFANCPP